MKKKTINNTKISIYDEKDFHGLMQAGQLAAKTLKHIAPFVQAGVTTLELNDICHQYILQNNAIPAPLNYKGYPKATCISLNYEICHGIPSNRKLVEGDILNIDVTVILNGYYGDTSTMFTVGKIHPKNEKLIAVTKECLDESIKILKPGLPLGNIGAVIEEIAHRNRFSVVEDFCGHGIGTTFHEEPAILHFGNMNEGMKLEAGMVFTIEPMINIGKKDTKMTHNGWTAITKDFTWSAQFEHMVGITSNSYVIFTELKD